MCSNCKVMYGKIDHWRTNADNDKNPFLKKGAHMLIADQIAKHLEDRDRRQIPQFTQDLFCVGDEGQDVFQSELDKFDRRDASTHYSSNKSLFPGSSDSVVRLHVGGKEPINSESPANVLTSASSLKISKLTSKMRALEKVALKHRRGDFGMPEKDFLELVFCPYQGQGKKDRSELKDFLNFRRSIELPPENLQLPVVAHGDMRRHLESKQIRTKVAKLMVSHNDEHDSDLDSIDEEFKNVDLTQYPELFSSVAHMKRETRKIQSPTSPSKHAHIQEQIPIKRAQKPKLTAIANNESPQAN